MKTPEKPASDMTWLAPVRPARAEIRVRGSRFLGVVAPVVAEDEAAEHLRALREEFPRATHHCWAFRIRRGEDLVERSSDTGEPSGTAGLPILRALESVDILLSFTVGLHGFVPVEVENNAQLMFYALAAASDKATCAWFD